MTYSFLTDGLEQEAKEKLDVMLEGRGTDTKAKARRERAAAESAMLSPR